MSKNIYKALSIKNAVNVFLLIYSGCKVEYYLSFQDICDKLSINPNSLRRITNSLSKAKLIKSVKDIYSKDKRKRVYIADSTLAELVLEIENPSKWGALKEGYS